MDKNNGRRNFLVNVLRLAVLGALGWIGFSITKTANTSGTPAHLPCSGDGICPRCPNLQSCPNAQAEAVRRGMN